MSHDVVIGLDGSQHAHHACALDPADRLAPEAVLVRVDERDLHGQSRVDLPSKETRGRNRVSLLRLSS